jgi:hypothetical protein
MKGEAEGKILTTSEVSDREEISSTAVYSSCNFKEGTTLMQLKQWERGFESHLKTLPQHLHMALTAVATVHIGKSTE